MKDILNSIFCFLGIHKFDKENYDLICEEDGVFIFSGAKVCKICGKYRKRIVFIDTKNNK